jgi:hypothetical protein
LGAGSNFVTPTISIEAVKDTFDEIKEEPTIVTTLDAEEDL